GRLDLGLGPAARQLEDFHGARGIQPFDTAGIDLTVGAAGSGRLQSPGGLLTDAAQAEHRPGAADFDDGLTGARRVADGWFGLGHYAEICCRGGSPCQSPRGLRCPARPALAPSRRRRNGMGKWPVLDKIEMVDGPIDDKDYERELTRLQHRLLDLQVYHLRPGGRAVVRIHCLAAAPAAGLAEPPRS